MKMLPAARNSDIVVQELKDELLIYNLSTNQAFCLNQTAKVVFEACDGKHTFNELKTKHQFDDDLIYLTLNELKKENLIGDNYISPFCEMNRREIIRKVGSASMIALPIISAVVAPMAAHAASVCSTACIPSIQDLCGGCPNGTVIYLTYYISTDGTCSGGNTGSNSITCNGYTVGGTDILRA